MSEDRKEAQMPDYPKTCVCGGSTERPNADCERCALIAELASLKAKLAEAEKERDEWKEKATGFPADPYWCTKLTAAQAEVQRLRERDQRWQEEAFISLAHCEAVGADKAAAVMRTLLLRMGIEEPNHA